MKKMLGILLSLMMLTVGAGLAEDIPPVETIIGTIVELHEDGSFLMQRLENEEEVLVKIDEDTQVEVNWALSEGDVVTVLYNGIMTFSLPPQVTAEMVHCFTLEGPVLDVDTDRNRVLVDAADAGETWVTLPEDADANDYVDKTVRIYFSGIMALSYPGQAHAYTISEIFMERGTITKVEEDSFLMDWNESELLVRFDAHTKVIGSFDVGDVVDVFYNGMMTRSMPGQINADVIVVETDPAE